MSCKFCRKIVPHHTFLFPEVTCDECGYQFTSKVIGTYHHGLRNEGSRWYHVFEVLTNLRCSNCNTPINWITRDCGDEDELNEYAEVEVVNKTK